MATPLQQTPSSANISRLISAAVINQRFRKLLLTNPEMALVSGYNGESFRLEREEKELVLSIQATSLSDFAMKVYARDMEEKGGMRRRKRMRAS
jgi:hypothetical protein